MAYAFAPLHGYAKNAPDFAIPNKDSPKFYPILHPIRRRGSFRGVCFCALHEYVKNAPDFILPDKDTPKTRPVLDPNRRRRTFGGVCNTPLHGYVKNLLGFIFPHTYPPKTHPISPFPIGICQKRTRFQTQTVAAGHFGAYAIRPYTGTPKNGQVSHSRTRIHPKPARF